MSQTRLRETLDELEQELARTDRLDAEARQGLEHAVAEMRGLLERSDEEPAEGHQSIAERLGEAAREFESEHPTLAEVVGRVATALSNMGI